MINTFARWLKRQRAYTPRTVAGLCAWLNGQFVVVAADNASPGYNVLFTSLKVESRAPDAEARCVRFVVELLEAKLRMLRLVHPEWEKPTLIVRWAPAFEGGRLRFRYLISGIPKIHGEDREGLVPLAIDETTEAA
jgi:hypothetical protein